MDYEEAEQYGPSWQRLAIAAFTVVLAGLGYYIGDTISGLRSDIKELRQSLAAHSAVAARLDSLQRETDDQEQRLRIIERQFWSRSEK